MAGWRETNTLKPIDSVTEKGGGEPSGRNESERTGGPEMTSPEGRARTKWVKAHMGTRKLTDTGIPLQRGGSDGMTARTHYATGEALAAPVEKSPEAR
jgi:hypothetical protein